MTMRELLQHTSLGGARLWVICPVYFDVESLRRLRGDILDIIEREGLLDLLEVRLVAVDDTGGVDPQMQEFERLDGTRVITVPFNLGHQRALVYGLRTLASEIHDDDFIVTMDSDGEDQPQDLPRLLKPLIQELGSRRKVVLAARTKRRESPPFKVLYFFFKNLFVLLTGTLIRSGNYAAFRGWMARNVIFHPHFDLCYSSSLLSLNLQLERVPCERGTRYAGMSKMTYLKLVMHGIRMLMPFADRIAIRGMIGFSGVLIVGILLGLAVVMTRLLRPDLAIPGWATYTLLLSIILSGMALGSVVLLFSLFVQSQSLSMSRLDVDLRRNHAADPRRAPAKPDREIA
ncbi:glycosyltransferase [Archangium minus]|uniref:Glycosyltransferase n=1 Tax=Archangium minus TaxID=83450 RepID=A0ABY9WSJ8_9BACT|nr:glycosyltransferase [Archangium violaceum]WNG45777.1 glycosyltransferase [Archangium minus]